MVISPGPHSRSVSRNQGGSRHGRRVNQRSASVVPGCKGQLTQPPSFEIRAGGKPYFFYLYGKEVVRNLVQACFSDEDQGTAGYRRR